MRCLDHHQPKGGARDKAIAARKILGARLPSERHFGDYGATLGDFLAQAGILGRVGQVETSGQDADRAGRQAALVCRRVDAACQAGYDAIAVAAKTGSQHTRHLDAGQRCVAGTDNGDPRQPEDGGIAFHRQ